MVTFEVPRRLSPEFMNLIPEQQEVIEQMLNSGEILSYSLAQDRKTVWVIVDAEDEDEAFDIINELPLTDFMKMDISPLMFSNSLQYAVPTFSAN